MAKDSAWGDAFIAQWVVQCSVTSQILNWHQLTSSNRATQLI